MAEHIKSNHQWQLWLIVIALGAPLPLAWVAWYWQIGVPDGKNVSGVLLPKTSNLFNWPLQPLGKKYHAEHPLKERQKKEPWYLVIECSRDCRSDDFWRLHRALGRDADRLIRYELTMSPTNVFDYNQPLPGAYWWQITEPERFQPNQHQTALDVSKKKHSIWLADPSGQIVLAYNDDINLATLLKDIRKVLRRNPEKPSWLPTSPDLTTHHQNQPSPNLLTQTAASAGEAL